jgi:hypothetical protein
MSVDADLSLSLSAALGGLSARVGGLCERLDRDTRFREKAAQASRVVPFIMNIPISGSAGSLNPAPNCGPDVGYFWSIRRLSATGFTAGNVVVYIDSTAGQPIWIVTGAAIGIYESDWGKGHQFIHPNSNLAVNATGITSANNQVIIYGDADQFESWLLPWYQGTVD